MADEHSHTLGAGSGIRLAFFLNLAFTVIEIVGGLWTNSLAIISDAIHDFGDSFALGLAWYLDRYSRRGKDERYSYGYQRFSLVGALINTIVLMIGATLILTEAIPRLFHPEHSNAKGMILFAVVGVIVNGLAALRVRREKSMNARVVMWHLFEDVLGWVAVLIVGVALIFADIHVLDPAMSIIITFYVLYNVIRNLRKTLGLFLQAVPEDVDIENFEKRLRAIGKVRSTHHTHVWSLDGEHHVLSTHVVVDEDITNQQIVQIKCEIKDITRGMGVEHSTIEIERANENCMMDSD